MSSLEFKTPEWMGPHDWVFERIRTETGRVGSRANALAKELADMDPSFRDDLLQWWRQGRIDMDRQVDGWSIRSLINSHHCKYPSEALTWLSRLTVDPVETRRLMGIRICTVIGGWDIPQKEPVH